jgi:1-aminocyclopropane-1-carboxylate deaminase
MLTYSQTPIQEIDHPEAIRAGVRLLIKREDLNHPYVSGNKWWKLKYNLEEAKRQNYQMLLTFGGAFSNHIYGTAGAAHASGLKSIGVIRGEEVLPLNHTLSFAHERGMRLEYLSREEYRQKNSDHIIDRLSEKFGRFYLIPEGGTNAFAVQGCEEWGRELLKTEFDHLILPIGTGGTMAGLIAGLEGKRKIAGISVLKGGEFLQADVCELLKKKSENIYGNWQVLTSYHHGGYAKVTEPLLAFTTEMWQRHRLPLDPVYTGKLLWAVVDMIKEGWFGRGSTILALHTGGLQGKYPDNIK